MAAVKLEQIDGLRDRLHPARAVRRAVAAKHRSDGRALDGARPVVLEAFGPRSDQLTTVTAQRKAWMLDTILDKISERGGSMQVQIKLLLSKYDDDKSGELDMGEFRNALGDFLHGMDDAEFAALAETFDADGSGAVSIAEFEEALTKLAKDREEHGRQTSGGALTGVKTTHPPRPGTAGAPRKISDQARAAAEDAVVTQFFHQLRLRARTMANVAKAARPGAERK